MRIRGQSDPDNEESTPNEYELQTTDRRSHAGAVEGDAMNFETRLVATRRLRRLSQRTLAELAGLSSPTLSSIEHGKTQLRLDSLTALCNALRCSADSLIYGDQRK